MGEIDEISSRLGGMASDIQHIKKITDSTDRKVDKTHDDMIVANAAVKSAHKRIDEVKQELREEIQPHITEYKNGKQQDIGRNGIISAIFGLVGAGIMYLVKGLF